ncbi:MAG: hypothetical protein ABI698_02695 [bacterium]
MFKQSATIHFSNVQANSACGAAVGDRFARVFGCWHKEMSRPFTDQGQTYRTCLDCGARRQFNLRRWEMQGKFYYGVPSSQRA